MKSIKSLIQELNLLRSTYEFKSLSLIDEHISKLETRIDNLEKKNMRYYVHAELLTSTSIGSGVTIFVPFDGTQHPQFGNMHDNIRDNDKIFIRRSGVYYVNFLGYITVVDAVPLGTVDVYLSHYRNGVLYRTWLYQHLHAAGGATANIHSLIPAIDYCYAGDYWSAQVYNGMGPVAVATIFYNVNYPYHNTRLIVSERMEDFDPSEYGLLDPNANTR